MVLSAAAFRLALVDELGMIGGREKGWVRMYLKFDKFELVETQAFNVDK